MSLYDLTGHPQLDEDLVEQGPEHLEWQTKQAEAALGATAPPMTGGALEAARDALVLQVNYQEQTGVDARMLTGSARAGVSFRSDTEGQFPLVDPMAAVMWGRALVLQAEQDAGAARKRRPSDDWITVRSVR